MALARNMRIFINDVDVSTSVALGSLQINMPLNGVVSTTMTFLALPEINVDHEIHLTLGDGAPPKIKGFGVEPHRRAFWLSTGLVSE